MIKILIKESSKFLSDSIKYEDENIRIETFGILLNYRNLLSKYKVKDLSKLIQLLYNKYSEQFISHFRGNFIICVFDKKEQKWLIYTNQIGDKRVYYSGIGSEVIISDSIKKITSVYKNKQQNYSLNYIAAYELLTYGHLLNEKTLVNEIKRLLPGNYLVIKKGNLAIKKYYNIDNEVDNSLKETEIIEGLDYHFRNAISLQFNKDIEYGYKHLVALSGGLDCRMTTWIADEMGYNNITNYTFSQYNYLDMTIAQKIADSIHSKWIYISLGNGDLLKDIENIIPITEGVHAMLAHTYYAHSLLPTTEYGIHHSGSLGDVIIGSYENQINTRGISHQKVVSNKLISKLGNNSFSNFKNQELYTFYNRGLNGILSSHLINQAYSETVSPFLDPDFLDFCFSIPMKYRLHHNIYKKWIIQRYPEASKIKWEKTNGYITEPSISIRKKDVLIRKIPSFIIENALLKFGIKTFSGSGSKAHMNPYEFWYRNNPSIGDNFSHIFESKIDLIEDKELKTDIQNLFNKGNVFEKMLVVNFLSSVNYLFN